MTRRMCAALAALLLAACHGDARRTGVPADTALRIPTDTAPRSASPSDSGALASSGAGLGDTTPGAAAPAGASAATVVLAADSAAGAALYHGRARCFTCHGQRGEGAAKLGPDLTDSAWVDGDGSLAAIRDAIARGVANPRVSAVAMPAYSGMLDSAEIARTADYVYTLSHPGATVADSARVDSVHADSVHADIAGAPDASPPGAGVPTPRPAAGDTTHHGALP
ncbi:MAG TPA: c-type cytochrome [Gemmatimonadaceae bacterium]|nr:c-type cytochrome [Gemmatimonadaceae bacterium]